MNALELKSISGCSLDLCKKAIIYATDHGGDLQMAMAYLRAKTLAVKTTCDFDKRVERFMRELK